MAGTRCAYRDDEATPHNGPRRKNKFIKDFIVEQYAVPEEDTPLLGYNKCRVCGQWSRYRSTNDLVDGRPMQKLADPDTTPAGPPWPELA